MRPFVLQCSEGTRQFFPDQVAAILADQVGTNQIETILPAQIEAFLAEQVQPLLSCGVDSDLQLTFSGLEDWRLMFCDCS
jgi:hypothetical protein